MSSRPYVTQESLLWGILRPLVAPDTRSVALAPALSRWASPDAGPVVPDLQNVAVADIRFFVIGGTTAILVSLMPHIVVAHLTLLRGEASLALACALILRVARGSLPRWV